MNTESAGKSKIKISKMWVAICVGVLVFTTLMAVRRDDVGIETVLGSLIGVAIVMAISLMLGKSHRR